MYHLYQGKIVKNGILQSSEIKILSKACIIITNLSALEMTLKIMQKWKFFNKKRKKDMIQILGFPELLFSLD